MNLEEINEMLSKLSADELTILSTEVMCELKRKVYSEGFDRGKLTAGMEEVIETVSGRLQQGRKSGREFLAESRQASRDTVVERAKADIEELTECDRIAVGGKKGFRGRFFVVNEEFIVNRDKRTVVCLLKGVESSKVHERGIAKAHPNDCFNVNIGKAIALRRALGLKIPDEYLNAPQPTEARSGDLVKSEWTGRIYEIGKEFNKEEWRQNDHILKIYDDSREEITNGRMYPRMDFNGRQ